MHLSAFFSAILLLATTVSAYLGACNGNIRLCDRSYSTITHIGTHNSAFYGPANLASNQERSVDDQLNAGIRFLQSQTHFQLNVLRMCHTNCFILDTGSFHQYLQKVRKWINGPKNQQQVVTLLVTNGDGADVSNFDTQFKREGLDKIAYVPPHGLKYEEWPTLQELIDSKKRLIVFMDYHSNTTKVPYILPQFQYYFETPHSVLDINFPQCNIDRPAKATPEGRMYLLNHYLDYKLFNTNILVSDKAKSDKVNSPGSILAHTSRCSAIYKRNPNVILVDWFNKGDVFKAQNILNGL